MISKWTRTKAQQTCFVILRHKIDGNGKTYSHESRRMYAPTKAALLAHIAREGWTVDRITEKGQREY